MCGWWLVTILTRTPNVPFTDEWSWAQLAIADRRHEPLLALLWEPHNGHRNVVGSLLFLAIDRIGGWSVIAEDVLGLAFLCIGLAFFRLYLARVLPPIARDIVFTFAVLLIAGSQAYENFLIGYNINWQICTAAALIMPERLTAKGEYAVVTAGALIVIASFSSGQGMLLWPAGGVVLLLQRRWRSSLTWGTLAAVCVATYLIGYHPGGQEQLRAHGLREAARFLKILLAVPLNVHFAGSALKNAGIVIGACIALTVVAERLIGVSRELTAGWYGLFVYGGLASVLTAWTRAGLGPEQALSPRYESLVAFVLIAAVGIGCQAAIALADQRLLYAAGVGGLALCAVAVLAVRWSASIVSVYEAQRADELFALQRHHVNDYARLADAPATVLQAWLADLDKVRDNPVRSAP